MRNLLLGVLVGLCVGAGLSVAGPYESLERDREQREQSWERFNAEQERANRRMEGSGVPFVEPVYPGLGRGPC